MASIMHMLEQWAVPFALYSLVAITRMHEIIRLIPCGRAATRLILLCIVPDALVSPHFGFLAPRWWSFPVWLLLTATMYILVPLACSKGALRQRCYMLLHLAVIFLCASLLTMALERLRMMLVPGTMDRLMNMACLSVIEMGFIIVLCQASERYTARIIPHADSGSFDPFLAFSTLQCLMIGMTIVVITIRGIHDSLFLLATLATSLICVSADIALGSVIYRELDMRDRQREADTKQVLMESYLAYGETMVQQAQGMARRRHDARNQLAVITMLVRRGQTSQARCQIKQLHADCTSEIPR